MPENVEADPLARDLNIFMKAEIKVISIFSAVVFQREP